MMTWKESIIGQKRPTIEETRRGQIAAEDLVAAEDMIATEDQITVEDLTAIEDQIATGDQKRSMVETATENQKRHMIEATTEMVRGGQKKEKEQEVLAPEEGDMVETVLRIMTMKEEEKEEGGVTPQMKDIGRGILAHLEAFGPLLERRPIYFHCQPPGKYQGRGKPGGIKENILSFIVWRKKIYAQ